MATKKKQSVYSGIISKYRDWLPVKADTRIISLCEGRTPLIKLENIPKTLPAPVEIYVKFEGLNPTGSFKDRGMTMAVTQAVREGARAIICASTGNTSASAAAYAARAGIAAFVLIPEGKIALGKLAQAMMKGAVVIQIQGNFDDGMRLVKEVAKAAPVTIVNSINPYRLQGQKTAAFEIVDELGRAPDFHCLPVGNAGNISAYWTGYSEYAGMHTKACAFCTDSCVYGDRTAHISQRPKMLGYQASGAAPFLRGHMVDNTETVATAIRIGHPQSWDLAWAASRESGGWFAEFSDPEILRVQKLLAEREGIFCEPASAIAVAGAIQDIEQGRIPAGSVIACTLTGHGLKDPDTAIKQSSAPVLKVDAKLESVKKAILDNMK
ncbi:MAG: threonine synthase [Gammaproteobacteria bacterium RIFCSPLOWO2_02_FULL_61_13]|nr:MAG: threonine synthase [Gammaproteobacteria bacterium RIFCSPLOWO2_02_FULL_61_13]